MGKRKKKLRTTEAGRTPEPQRRYGLGELLAANAVAWSVFLLITYMLTKSFEGPSSDLLSFYSFIGIGFSIGSVIDYSLENF